ncbi:MAG TPA: hypothetical protein VNN18_11690 [Candidatus Xenobia bacterium]|nr:hypothetical protein [Candidatus Xenobia bacterium]
MAKAQGKAKAVKRPVRAVNRPKASVKASKARPPRPAARPVKAAKKAAAKSARKAAKKAVPKAVRKAAPKAVRKAASKAVGKAAPKAVRKVVVKAAKSAMRAAAGAAAPAPVAGKAAKSVAAKVAKPAAPAPAAQAVEKKRGRRARPRIHSDGTPVAAWLTPGEKPRPSSFIPAPPRAEAPSLVAAPPASSDRLFREDDIATLTVRTVPVRVDVEQGGGRVHLAINPEEAVVRVGEGIEWDFRYIGGADVTVDELVIEFEKPSPFSSATFRSRKPGIARPHRQLSGAAQKSAAGRRVQYTIRAMTPFRTELAIARPWIVVE